MLRSKVAWCFLLFLGAPCFAGICIGQSLYLSKLFDGNQTLDGGTDVFIKPDSSYFIRAFAYDINMGTYGISNLTVSMDGQTILAKNIINDPTVNIATGLNGSSRRYLNGYIAPYGPDQRRVLSGIIVYNRTGDTVFTRTFTDTTMYDETTLNIHFTRFYDTCSR